MARFTGKSFLREEHPVEKQNRMNKAKKKILKDNMVVEVNAIFMKGLLKQIKI